MRKVHLGCGTNRLPGWENFDSEVDITKLLPFPSQSIDYIFIEHCLEHITPTQGVSFLENAHGILVRGGVIRIAVPSLPKIARMCDRDYAQFAGGSRREAMKRIVTHHGHQTVYDLDILTSFLEIAGFEYHEILAVSLYDSTDPQLKNTNHHWTVIGKHHDEIETICVEARKT